MVEVLEIKMRLLCHATEDINKVLKALENVVGSLESIEIKQEHLTGHYGDTIILLSSVIKDRKLASQIFFKILQELSEYEKHMLLSECLEERFQEVLIYIRLDKQAAYEGKIKLSEKDAIRLEVRISDGKEFIRSIAGSWYEEAVR